MKKRESNIELMRIICIILVIMHHYSVHGAWGDSLTGTNEKLIRLLEVGGKFAINCFVLITGYFGITSATDVKKKIMRLCADRWFYAVAISFVMVVFGLEIVNIQYVMRAIFPVLTCRHNYITTFVMLYMFIPFINKFINNLSKEEMKKFLGLAIIIFSVIPTIMSLTGLYTNNVYSYLTWMILLYCIGAYIRKFVSGGAKKWNAICCICFAVMIFCALVVEEKSELVPALYTTTVHNIIVLACACSFFCYFVNTKIKYNRVINSMASSTFGVLLIHDDPLVRNIIWTLIFRNAAYADSQYLWLHALLTVGIIYFACILIDKVYSYTIKVLFRKLEKVRDSQ